MSKVVFTGGTIACVGPTIPETWSDAWGDGRLSVLRAWFLRNVGPKVPLNRVPLVGVQIVNSQAAADALVGRIIQGSIQITVNNIDLHDFKVHGDGTGILVNIVGVRNNIIIRDFEIDGNGFISSLGIGGASYATGVQVLRGDLHSLGQDGLRLMNTGVYRHVYIHDMWKWDEATMGTYVPNGSQAIYPHTDGMQAVRGGGLIEQCWIDNRGTDALNATSALIFNPSGAAIDGWVAQYNYINGGGYAIHAHDDAYGLPTGLIISNNRFGRGSRLGLISAADINPTVNLTYENNVWADTLLPVPVYPASIITAELSTMMVGVAFAPQTIESNGAPAAFSAVGLPVGLTLSTTGVLSGIPMAAGAYSATIMSGSASKTFTGTVAAGSGGLLFQEDFSSLGLSTDAKALVWRTRGLDDQGSLSVGYKDYAGSNWNVSPTQHPENSPFSVTDSVLTIQASRTPEGISPAVDGAAWMSGYLVTDPRSGLHWKEGYFEARIRYSAERGGFPAFWMFRSSTSPLTDGKEAAEIDAFEVFGTPTGRPWSYGWHQKPTPGTSSAYSPIDSDTSDWHVYAIERVLGAIRWYRDGVLIQELSTGYYSGLNMGIRVNLAVDPSWIPEGDVNRSTASDPAMGGPKLEVDWVRVWSAKPQ